MSHEVRILKSSCFEARNNTMDYTEFEPDNQETEL